MATRRTKLQALRAAGHEPFPYRYEVSYHAHQLTSLDDADFPESAAVAGRVVSIRRMGKASFVHIQDATGKLQIYLKRDDIGEEAYETVFGKVDLGDLIGVSGEVFRTRTGEISAHGRALTLLAKSLRPLPGLKEKDGEVFDPFEDKEHRYRQRYLDLIVNPEVKQVFVERARIISQTRAFLDKSGFLEVETPALQPLYGGASARPFTTHHNTLDQQLYLRIADELYLKRLIIGGFEKVYEIAKNFRNEGMDKNHNPEFTALEFYWAYADYHDTLKFTEELIRSLAEDLGRTTVAFQGHTIDLSQPFRRESLFDLLHKFSATDFTRLDTVEQLYEFATDKDIGVPPDLNYGQLLDKLFGALVEPHLIEPIFVVDHPKAISPLAKTHRDGNDQLVERFELFIAGMEFANAFTELNDPIDQRERFEEQAALRAAGDEEAQVVDEDFLQAMEYGMPPMSGVGIGIDRLIMLLTEQNSIKDVILFPAMRPLK